MFAFLLRTLILTLALATPSLAATKAEILIDLQSGVILHSKNPQERVHPASLTKMMTLYLTFDAVRRGELALGTTVTVSKKAADQPPSRMNLKAGQTITIADLVRGVAIQSANDGAMALAEAVGGDQAGFVARMNAAAQAMGLVNTTFRNPHGLTDPGQLTSARDMGALARRLRADFPEHFGLFGLREVRVGKGRMPSTNRRFLSSYPGATGLKTGYTRAAGYNLAATAERNGREMLAVVLGAGSSPERLDRVRALLDAGFGTPAQSQMIAQMPPISIPSGTRTASAPPPAPRAPAGPHGDLRAALSSPGGTALVSDVVAGHADTTANAGLFKLPASGGFRPILVAGKDSHWGVQIGLYPSRHMAEKTVLETTLAHLNQLGGAPQSIVKAGNSWSAAYVKMDKGQAESSCRHLLNNGVGCAIFSY